MKEQYHTSLHHPRTHLLWNIPKKLDILGNKKWDFGIGYLKLNEFTVDDKNPLPNISDLLPAMSSLW